MENESQMLNKSFGLKLQELRKGQKISKPEFAKYINVSLEDLDNYEKGDTFPPENVIANIIQILKIEPSELFAFNQYIEQLTNNQEYARIKQSLTPREFQVLWYMCRGYDNPEIAEVLEVSTHTAKAHVAAILRKFGVKTRTAVAYIAGKNYMV